MKKPIRILYVDDYPLDRELVKDALEREHGGFQLTEAASRGEFEERFADGDYDLVLSDFNILGFEGLQVIDAIQTKDPLLPVVIVTGTGSEEVAVEAMKRGAADYVIKSPKKIRRLPHTIMAAIEKKQLQDEHRQAAVALRESEARYRAMIENMSDGVAILRATDNGEEFVFMDFNVAAERMSKRQKEDVIGRSLLHIFPQASKLGMLAVIRRVWSTGQAEQFPVSHYQDDELDVWFGTFIYRLPSGEIAVITTDETQRKQAEEALRQSEERLRAIFEGTHDLIFIKDRNLKYTDVNPALEHLLGLAASEIVERDDVSIFGKKAGDHLRRVELRVLNGESIEQEHTRPVNGESYTFLDIRVPLRDPKGDIIGICGISRNITERRKAMPRSTVTVEDFPSAAMRQTLEQAKQAAATDGIVLLQGESGSGKDYLAQWIHDHSRRADSPFFAINCAALPPELAESELFGHEPGSFTGAKGRKRGLLELAEGGTLLLNEIGELSTLLQAKLLSFLDNRSFLRVGGEKHIRVDARLMAATHRTLADEVAAGRFLEPLFYRLDVFTIRVPPLRERTDDIPVLVKQILERLTANMPVDEVPEIDPGSLRDLAFYRWPGNVRELRNVIERALILADGGRLVLRLPLVDAEFPERSYDLSLAFNRTLREVTDEVTKAMCLEALRRSNGNKKEAASILEISRDSLYRYIKRFGIESESETHE